VEGIKGEEFQKVFSFHLFVHASFIRLFACEKKTVFITFFVILSLFNPMVKMVPLPNEMTLIENQSTSNNSIGLFINVPKLKKIIKNDLKFEILEDRHIFMDLINKTSDESEKTNLKSVVGHILTWPSVRHMM